MIRLAEARRAASIIRSNSIRFSAGPKVDWIKNKVAPRTDSLKLGSISPSMNRVIVISPSCLPRHPAISSAKYRDAVPEKILKLDAMSNLKVVGRGGLEPPLTEPKSAVLPLDDQPSRCLTGYKCRQVFNFRKRVTQKIFKKTSLSGESVDSAWVSFCPGTHFFL